jgi:hypothetical protein
MGPDGRSAPTRRGPGRGAAPAGRDGPAACRAKFLKWFPRGFADPQYVAWERGYKATAHERFESALSRRAFAELLAAGRHAEVAAHAVRIESRTNLLFSFEKMALRDAVRRPAGARRFAEGLFALLHGGGGLSARFEAWIDAVAGLPRRQTRVLTWPVLTVFPFLAKPRLHVFLKPNVTRRAAAAYGFDFAYRSKPSWETYASLLELARTVERDLADLRPRDRIDVQSFLWVLGSDEYPD